MLITALDHEEKGMYLLHSITSDTGLLIYISEEGKRNA